jgi:hypothetical protein
MVLGTTRRRTLKLGTASLAATLLIAGCHADGGHRKIASAEPAFSGTIESDGPLVVESPPTPTKSIDFVERHPLLSKPRDYWESSSDNKLVKAAAATFVGVPAGVLGEVRQIFVGSPPEDRY